MGSHLSLLEAFQFAVHKAKNVKNHDNITAKIKDFYDYSIYFPSVIRKALEEQPLMMCTHAGRHIAIEDTISVFRKSSVKDVVEFAETLMRDEINAHWNDIDQERAVSDYLERRKHIDYKKGFNDFDRIKKIFSHDDYEDHVSWIAIKTNGYRNSDAMHSLDPYDLQKTKLLHTLEDIQHAANGMKICRLVPL